MYCWNITLFTNRLHIIQFIFHSFIQAKCTQGKGNLQSLFYYELIEKCHSLLSPPPHLIQAQLVKFPYNTQKTISFYTKHRKVSLIRQLQTFKLFTTQLDKLPGSF